MAKAKKLRRYMVTAEITGRKFLGYFDAESADAAIAQAEKQGDLTVSLCHQCAEEIESAECGELFAEEVERNG